MKKLILAASLALFLANGAQAQTPVGTPNDPAWSGSGAGTLTAVLKGIYNQMLLPVPAGTNVIGKFGVDQTTPGTTNAVQATNLPATVDTNTGNASANTPRSVIATNQPAIAAAGQGATGAAPPSGASQMGAIGSGATGGLMVAPKTCDLHASYDASTSGSTKIVTGVSGRKVYICGLLVQTGGTATNVKLVEGTGTNCGTGSANITPAYQLAANSNVGFMSAFWTGMASATNADDVCINASAANAVQADLFYAIQ